MNTSLAWASPSDADFAADFKFETVEDAIEFASFVLWSLSGRRWGPVKVTTEAYDTRSSLAAGSQVYPVFQGGKAYNVSSCGSCQCAGCGVFHRTRLRGYPVRSIFEVWVNGCSLPRSDYVLLDNSVLGLMNPEACGAKCIVVKYAYGSGVPPGGKNAVLKLAKELLESSRGGDCSLPERVTSVSRQGMSWTLLDPQDFLDQGRTGIYEIDLLLKALNPSRALMRPRVFSPDLERATVYQYEPPPMSLLVREDDQVIMHGYAARFVTRNSAILSSYAQGTQTSVTFDNGLTLTGHWHSFGSGSTQNSLILDLTKEEVDKIPNGAVYHVIEGGREIARGHVHVMGETYVHYPSTHEQEQLVDKARGVRSVHVTTGATDRPTDNSGVRGGDLHINVNTGATFYYNPTSHSWEPLGGKHNDDIYWGHGNPLVDSVRATRPATPKPDQAYIDTSFDLWVYKEDSTGNRSWTRVPIREGDEYVDLDSGTVYALKAG